MKEMLYSVQDFEPESNRDAAHLNDPECVVGIIDNQPIDAALYNSSCRILVVNHH